MTGDPDKNPGNFLVGLLIGVGSVLPGVSGGVIAVAFGVYERLVGAIGELRSRWREEFWFLAILGSGIVLGMGLTAVGMRLMIDAYEVLLVCAFLGLIVGQLPEVWGLARDSGGPGASGTVAAALGFAAMVALIYFEGGDHAGGAALEGWEGALILAFAGLVIALSKIVPGLSGSALLMAMGLYSALIVGVTDLDLFYIAFLGVGFVVGIFAFAKIMDAVLKAHRVPGTHLILGLTLGCVPVIAWEAAKAFLGDMLSWDGRVPVIAWEAGGIDCAMVAAGILAAGLGLAVGWAFGRYARARG